MPGSTSVRLSAETSAVSASQPSRWWTSGAALVAVLAIIKLALQLIAANHYGIFRDEMYYLACGLHLSWGYVDHPPLMPFIAWLVSHTLGRSLLALRLLPALAGAALVFLTGMLAREMGGGRTAQVLAALAVLVAPIYMLFQHWFTMNAFEPLLWTMCAWCVVRFLRSDNRRWWLLIGILTGIGLELKYPIALFAVSLLIGLALTPCRRVLLSPWLWMGAAAAALIFLPHFVWLVRHHFPFLEYEHNIRMSSRDVRRGPLAFLLDQADIMNMFTAPIWIGGVVWCFRRAGVRYRVLAWSFLVVLGTIVAMQGKNYYAEPIYPMMLAAGAVGWAELVRSRRILGGYTALMVGYGALLAPVVLPLLPPAVFLRYVHTLHIRIPKAENQPTGPLPQYFADEFGWEDMVRKTAAVYWSLPAEERARTAIFANDWGEAAAIDYFGPKYGLPRAISNHNSYWFWGPRDYDGSTMIVLGSDGSGDRKYFRTVIADGQVDNSWSREDEHFTIWLCRGLKGNLQALWPQLKKWD
jgi:Dolichyl-phosphate-mannose-protein mannosyltransferase